LSVHLAALFAAHLTAHLAARSLDSAWLFLALLGSRWLFLTLGSASHSKRCFFNVLSSSSTRRSNQHTRIFFPSIFLFSGLLSKPPTFSCLINNPRCDLSSRDLRDNLRVVILAQRGRILLHRILLPSHSTWCSFFRFDPSHSTWCDRSLTTNRGSLASCSSDISGKC